MTVCVPAFRNSASTMLEAKADQQEACRRRERRDEPCSAIPGLAVYLVQGSLVFFNIDYVRDRIRWIVNRLPRSTRWFVLDAEAVTTIDSTAVAVLAEIKDELLQRNVRLGLANLHAQPRELLARSGLLASIGPQMLFMHLEDAALAFREIEHRSPGNEIK